MSVTATGGAAALPLESEDVAEEYESKHVHQVYETIAPHFSATRFKPWPIVERFLLSRPVGAIGLDIGCGNGKYLGVNPNVFMIGSDRSSNLVKIGRLERGYETVVGDALDLPHPLQIFDFAISIAVIHHFSSRTRRVAAIKSILSILKRRNAAAGERKQAVSDGRSSDTTKGDSEGELPSTNTNENLVSETPSNEGQEGVGQALIYVWALEQKSSRRGWDENSPQDMFVPWVLQKGTTPRKGDSTSQKEGKRSKKRIGNSGREGKQADEIVTGDTNQSETVGGNTNHSGNNDKKEGQEDTKEQDQPPVFMRYYHLYRKGELEEDVIEAGGAICESGYEKDNWWAIIRSNESAVTIG